MRKNILTKHINSCNRYKNIDGLMHEKRIGFTSFLNWTIDI